SSSGDGTIRVWDVASVRLRRFPGHENPLHINRTNSPPISKGQKVIYGRSHAAVTAVSASKPFRAVWSRLEVIVEDESGKPVAWYPADIDCIAVHPSGRTWVGGTGTYLCLFSLEGG